MNPKYILILSAVIAAVFSATASIIPLGVYNQWEVSALYDTLFTPATFTFSIWSLIYLSWLILWVYILFSRTSVWKSNALLLWWAQILSSLWLIPSQYLYIGVSLVVMLWVLGLLMKLFFDSRTEHHYFRHTVDLFLGWIIVASIANLHLTLVSFDLYTYPVIFTVISILLWLVINTVALIKYNSYVIPFVLIWSLIWIILWQENTSVIITASFSLTTITLLTLEKLSSIKK